VSFSCRIPVANVDAANAALQAAGWGPGNFSVPIYTTAALPAFAALHHIGNDAAFQAACAAIPGAVVLVGGQLVRNMDATATAAGGRWGSNAPLLQGQVTPGLYRAIPADGGGLWTVIQAFDRAVFGQPLKDLAALVRKAKVPGVIEPWVQPIDQFDAYFTKNKITGQPDRVTHLGRQYRSAVADPTPNVWVPGAGAEWVDEGLVT
jgi:hypothetical protein